MNLYQCIPSFNQKSKYHSREEFEVLHYELEIPLNSNIIANKTLLISFAAHVFSVLIECNRCCRTVKECEAYQCDNANTNLHIVLSITEIALKLLPHIQIKI
ncbi:hypothetical protein T12_13125 [Trichinella patagoniensis]|uniref:Uncharacterized protein n=1 Tax=Trichinella patagoniensis TaxID=990121 RepID=A0A0V1A3Z6_9BILA|nr:hypothetical protein T12_13125 [Trichinella patagoniensis]